ncbi:MAG TPA: hypothetical protein VG407_05195 [Caulobacteraceae bacterium]|nr:hypothetical protein [Caulobacteraceae bacterium]
MISDPETGGRQSKLTAAECLRSAKEWEDRARLALTDGEREAAQEMADSFRKVAKTLNWTR